MAFVTALTVLLAATGSSATPFNRRATDGLNIRAVAAGKQYFGSATDNGELSNSAYLSGLSNTADFGQITPGNSMKWDSIEPSRGSFSYSGGDTIQQLAVKNGQKLRCHTLVWHSQLPNWVSNGGFDNATLISVMKNHITNEMTHYKGKCFHWDVVNEALNEDGTFRSSVFYNTIGPAFIPIAFATAASVDPDAKLYYNDYNTENAGSKSTGAQNIVKLIKQYGAKIDGVGFQSHFIVGSTPSQSAQVSNMNAFVSLGVEVAITELDIRTNTPATSSAVAQQAKDYAATIGACKAVAKCVGVTIWDYTDKYSWIPGVFSGQGSALPWDDNLNKKTDIYNAILNAWGSAPTGGATSSAASSATVAPPASTSAVRSTTTSAAPAATSSAAGPVVAKWGQCGGVNWNGGTVCESGSSCTKFNDYYSQCI
ncbi:putative endo-1,4-beta-xylanase [Clohesyomyces aquaticus]|uniref:Beta-xylanase n=1 Tax=Clohesyomyces aquaticus TaxID=1231657 RepID=A0A1Y1ZMG3_9PLEO|nr:putative endo-1,4-beta-xylanase [Clohesyomyces aquaticus]